MFHNWSTAEFPVFITVCLACWTSVQKITYGNAKSCITWRFDGNHRFSRTLPWSYFFVCNISNFTLIPTSKMVAILSNNIICYLMRFSYLILCVWQICSARTFIYKVIFQSAVASLVCSHFVKAWRGVALQQLVARISQASFLTIWI